LAGVLLKLGGYDLLRVFPVLFKFGFRFGGVRVALSLVGGVEVQRGLKFGVDRESCVEGGKK